MARALPITLVLLALACGPPALEPGSPTETTAEGSTSEGADSSGTTTTTSGPSFVSTKFDLPGDNDCDAYAQDCPEGEKCVPYASGGGSWDDHKCVPIMGDQATGEPCVYGGVVEATDNCDATGICWDVIIVDDEPIGTCHSFCTGTLDQPECPEGSECLIASDSTVNICLRGCDPLIQDCLPGLACYYANDFNCIFTTQDIAVGEPCGFINDCAAGLACLATELFPACEGSACCSPFCRLELGDGPCEAVLPGTVCAAFFEEDMAPPGYEHVGVCIVP